MDPIVVAAADSEQEVPEIAVGVTIAERNSKLFLFILILFYFIYTIFNLNVKCYNKIDNLFIKQKFSFCTKRIFYIH